MNIATIWSSTEALLQALLDKVVVADAALPHCIGSKLGFKLASEWGGTAVNGATGFIRGI